MALEGHEPTADDLVILFTSADYDVEALYPAAAAEAAPAGVFGCTSTGRFTHTEQVPSGCVAALLAADESSFGICHVERDDADIAGSARLAAQTRASAPAIATRTRSCCCSATGSRPTSARSRAVPTRSRPP